MRQRLLLDLKRLRRQPDRWWEEQLLAAHRTARVCASRRWRLPTEDAEDVAQDTVVKLLLRESLPDLIEAWVLVVVRHLVIKGRLRAVRPALPPGALPPASYDPRPGLILHQSLGEAFLELRPVERRLLVGLLAELSHRELAAMLGCGIGQVGQRVKRLRAKLRGSLAG